MQSDFDGSSIIVGLKQSLKAVKNGDAKCAYVAENADAHIREPFIKVCGECCVEVKYYPTMEQLGAACGIDVGAAVVVVKKG